MSRHKHAAIIHAFAEGAKVQYRYEDDHWLDIADPCFLPEVDYRVKPASFRPARRFIKKGIVGNLCTSISCLGEQDPQFVKWIDPPDEEVEV